MSGLVRDLLFIQRAVTSVVLLSVFVCLSLTSVVLFCCLADFSFFLKHMHKYSFFLSNFLQDFTVRT